MANPNEQPTRVLLSAATQAAANDVRSVLERAGYAIAWHDLGGDGALEPGPFQLIVVDGSRQQQRALQLCRRLRSHLADGFVPLKDWRRRRSRIHRPRSSVSIASSSPRMRADHGSSSR